MALTVLTASPNNMIFDHYKKKDDLPNRQQDEAHLILVDRHMCQIRESLDLLKQQLRSAPDPLDLLLKVEVLRGLVNELNVMTQYRKEILDDLKSEVSDSKHSNTP